MVLTEQHVEDMIVGALDAATVEITAQVVEAVRHQLVEVVEERFNNFRANMPPPNVRGPREFQNRDFTECKPSEFKGGRDPIISMRWIAEVEGAFVTSGCPENKKVSREDPS